MNITGLASPSRGELWQWVGTDKFGKSQKYQTHGPNISEASMLGHLQRTYHGLKITDLKRITSGQYVPPNPDTPVEEHAYMSGARAGFREDFAKMNPREQGQLIEQAMNLRPIHLDNKWGSVPDPMTNAVCDAVWALQNRKPKKPRSIRDQFHSVRNLLGV
jgi:hypothetical protein